MLRRRTDSPLNPIPPRGRAARWWDKLLLGLVGLPLPGADFTDWERFFALVGRLAVVALLLWVLESGLLGHPAFLE